MSEFTLYLNLGFAHITDIGGYDHILFLVALCAAYDPGEYRKLILLATAFSLGHSLTLALSVPGIMRVDAQLIEFLIPVTILLTALHNIFGKRRQEMTVNYAIAAFFGLIHGMGFSNYLRMLLGQEESITMPLFAFNAGLEIGQIIIVSLFVVLSLLVLRLIGLPFRKWRVAVSAMAASVALYLVYVNKIW